MREPSHEEHELSTADLARSAPTAEMSRGGDTMEARRAGTVTDPARRGDGNGPGAASAADQRTAPLFASDEAERFRGEWAKIQADFVDEPGPAVQQADALVASVMKRLAEVFAEERGRLENQWHGGDISTEDLRVALQRYRSFFTRLLSV